MTPRHASGWSLRARLLVGILVPVLLFMAVNTASLYREALHAADTAYDRTLLASAKSIGELLEVVRDEHGMRLRSSLSYAALEPFEADNRSRLFYRVSGFAGEMVSGFDDLPAWHGTLPAKGPYAALVDFYDAQYRGQPVRMAVLLQPVAGLEGLGMATIQVAETLELRRTLARQVLVDTLWRQLALAAVIAAVVVAVVQRATEPVRALSASMQARSEGDLSPIEAAQAPRELRPLIEATNQVMRRLAGLLDHQKRFVRDASHQLRTPLAVLKAQLQSALRGDLPAEAALREMSHTVDGATQLANQMLALAKVEQLRQQGDAPVLDTAGIVRGVALDLSALIAERQLDFSIETEPAAVRAHEWALRELMRNLLHNAIKFSPVGGGLAVRVTAADGEARLGVADSGPGLAESQRERLFQPFARGGDLGEGAADDRPDGTGLGLAICDEIVRSLGGRIELVNRVEAGHVRGLDAHVRLPLADNRSP